MEGAIVVKALSANAHWRRAPTWLDTLDEEEYSDLSARKQRRYRREDDLIDEGSLDDEDGDEDDVIQFGPRYGRDRSRPTRYLRVDRDGVPTPRRRYMRDSAGRAADHGYYRPDQRGRPKRRRDGKPRVWEEDRNATRRAYREEQREWLAQRLPFEVEVI